MGAGHAHALYVHGHSRVHAMAPEAKVAAALGFVTVVALTPADLGWAFAGHAVVLAAVARTARLSVRFVASRALVVVPFIAFVALIPFVATGPRTEVLGVAVSAEGLVAARTILCKAVLGVTTTVVLAATTETTAIMRGLNRLRVPTVMTAIATFMLRYLEVLTGELGRMRTAMTARGYDPRWLWQARPIASSAGALFVRSYERGERVHAAMLARGFDGTMPVLDDRRAGRGEWAAAAALPLLALLALLAAAATRTLGGL
ncbi:cobalt ECF transporter T component CbiQ [Euzebya sp.]|uniref:cobalt ECF transporter T component CbiQ n=1 Tax=Euzebya sp. TaxID=1971409 RepID=UPI00351729BE